LASQTTLPCLPLAKKYHDGAQQPQTVHPVIDEYPSV
jgi:hypothetical protein